MKVSIEQFESTLNTLPISLYAGRDITVSLSNSAESSYYAPLEDTITISYPSMAAIYEKIYSDKELESSIRAVLYHEISHALLTPVDLYGNSNRLMCDVINVFEDERIETIFKNYYYGVDFKRNIIMLNNWHGEEPTNAFEAFYNTVRFRSGETQYLSRVNQLIEVYHDIVQIRECQYGYNNKNELYRQDIQMLFLDIAKDWMEENQKEELEKIEPNYDDLTDQEKRQVVSRALQKMEEDNPGKLTANVILTSPSKGESKGNTDGQRINMNLTEEELRKLLESMEENFEDVNEDPQKLLDSCLNKFVDHELIENIKMIFENFLSRTKNNSGAINRYSGVLDPRLIGREDWRIFQYKSQNGPIKGYDKLHLNLFIDTSGSYRNNQDKTNTILKALEILEETYQFFSFDLVTCQCGEQKHDRKHRYIEAYGGNNLDNKIFDIYKELQDTQAFNYNIVLFDGDAFTDCRRDTRENSYKNFGAFNNSKCSIISDADNQKAIEKFAPQAHSIIVDRRFNSPKSYADMLFENILNSLTRALL